MKITLSKVLQGINHPNLARLYLAGLKRQRDNLREYDEGKYKLSHLPCIVRIEPTNKCNLRCIMCPIGQSGSDRGTGFMDMGLYENIIDEVRHFPYPTWLILYLGGEPLLHNGLADMIKVAKAKGLYCRFNTNATLLSGDRAEAILRSGLDCIGISFDDVSPMEYEAIRRNASYEKTLTNIVNFLRLKKKYRKSYPLVSIESIKLRNNNDSGLELGKDFRLLFGGYSIQSFKSAYGHLWAGDFAENSLYQYKRGESNNASRCKMLWDELTINWQGDVVACCYDLKYDCIIGNVRDSKIVDIWNNTTMVGMRRLLHSGKYDEVKPCSTCSLVKGEVATKAMA